MVARPGRVRSGRRTAVLALVGRYRRQRPPGPLGVGVLLLQGGTGGVIRPQDLLALVVPSAIVNGLLAVALYLVARAAMTRLGYEPVTA